MVITSTLHQTRPENQTELFFMKVTCLEMNHITPPQKRFSKNSLLGENKVCFCCVKNIYWCFCCTHTHSGRGRGSGVYGQRLGLPGCIPFLCSLLLSATERTPQIRLEGGTKAEDGLLGNVTTRVK